MIYSGAIEQTQTESSVATLMHQGTQSNPQFGEAWRRSHLHRPSQAKTQKIKMQVLDQNKTREGIWNRAYNLLFPN